MSTSSIRYLLRHRTTHSSLSQFQIRLRKGRKVEFDASGPALFSRSSNGRSAPICIRSDFPLTKPRYDITDAERKTELRKTLEAESLDSAAKKRKKERGQSRERASERDTKGLEHIRVPLESSGLLTKRKTTRSVKRRKES